MRHARRSDAVAGPLINGLPFVNDYRDAQRHSPSAIDVRAAQGVWDGSEARLLEAIAVRADAVVKVSSYLIGLAPPGFAGGNAASRRSAREQLCELAHLPAGEDAVCR